MVVPSRLLGGSCPHPQEFFEGDGEHKVSGPITTDDGSVVEVELRSATALRHGKTLKTVGCKMAVPHFICSVTVSLCLLTVVVVGMPDARGQFGKLPRSKPLLYARPPVQVLNEHPSNPRNVDEASQPPATPSGNSIRNVEAVLYGSGNSQLLPFSSGVISRGNDQVNGRDPLPSRNGGRMDSNQPSQPNLPRNNLGKDFPIFTAPSAISNGPLNSNIPRARPSPATSTSQFPAFPSNVLKKNPVKVSPPKINHPNIFDSFNKGGNTDFGQRFGASSGNSLLKPRNTEAQQTPAPPRQDENGNNFNIPILARGFSVPTTYTNRQGAEGPEQADTLSAVANPSDNKQEVIGSYLPRNDFVNPELFVIPTEDKRNIVNRIFGGFQNPTAGNINPQTPNLDRVPYSPVPTENYASNVDFFNKQGATQEQSNENPTSDDTNGPTVSTNSFGKNADFFDLFNKQGGRQVSDNSRVNGPNEERETAPRPEPQNFIKDNSINLNKFDPALLPQGNTNVRIPNFDKSYSSLGTFPVPDQKGFTFDGVLKNPGSFTGSKQPNTFSTNANVSPAQESASQNTNPATNGERPNALNINAFPDKQKSLFGNAPSFNSNQISVGNKGFGTLSNFGRRPQVGNPTEAESVTESTSRPANDLPNRLPKFNTIDSFQSSDLFSNPKPSFGGPSPAPNTDASDLKDRNSFSQPAPVPLFSDFSQAKPLTVDLFRSKNLLGDENFGRTEYDRTRPTSLNVLSDEDDFFGGDKFFEGNNFNLQPVNKNLGKGSGLGQFQQVGGSAVTSGDSYDNVYSTKQGYNKNFNDNNNVASSKPSSLTEQGGFTNTYQQNNGFERAGAVSDGKDYGSQFSFNDGDNVSNQKTSSNHNEGNFRNSFEDEQHAGDQKSYSNADGYNNAFVNGRRYDLSDGYTDNVNYNTQNSGSSEQGSNNQDDYRKGVANVAANLANHRPNFYANLPTSVSQGLPQETSYKPFDINKPVFNGVVLS